MHKDINFTDYDVIIVNSSGGKDSLVTLYETVRIADEQQYCRCKIHVSHQDLGEMEWPGVLELVTKQANMYGLKLHVTRRRDMNGKEESLLDYVRRRGKWPSRSQRYCTSDFKRGPGARVVTEITRNMGDCRVLYVFGFRAEESPFRSKKQILSRNERLTTQRRVVDEWLPVHTWTKDQVWETIRGNGLPYHYAYDLGMPRLSCVICIFSPMDALIIGGIANPELLDEYIAVEDEIGHLFRDGFSLHEVKAKIATGYVPKGAPEWVM
jgi:3'-phosphoadenosine 5'-phosphosulfate sulfotransferase (PAPS reductase)/FAD synthetase